MLPEKLKELLKLISQTGDRLIVFDTSVNEDAFVLMDLDNYRKIIGTERIAPLKPLANNSDKQVDILSVSQDLAPISENLTEEDLTDKINREISMWKNGVDKAYVATEEQPRKAWQIPAKVKDNAQEIAS